MLIDILYFNIPLKIELESASVVLTNLHLNKFIEVVATNEAGTQAKYRLTEKGYALLMYSLKFN